MFIYFRFFVVVAFVFFGVIFFDILRFSIKGGMGRYIKFFNFLNDCFFKDKILEEKRE